jgi:thioredoxin reductase
MQDPSEFSHDVDVVIVGGGAAGLAAAVALGRARRSVVVIDSGEPRNAPAAHMHNYLSRDGMSPKEFLAIGHDEALRYGARFVESVASTASRAEDGSFAIELADGASVTGRRLLVTTGLVDELPDIQGLRERWGRDVIHCPYCHGWEVSDQRIVVISSGPMSVHQAQLFRQWSPDVTLLLHTGPHPTALQRDELASRSIGVVDGEVVSVVIEDDRLVGVAHGDGRVIPADAVVVGPRMIARSAVLSSLGLVAVEHPMGVGTQIPSDPTGATEIPGVWVAGNVTELNAQVVHAAGAGTFAGAAINADLIADDTRRAMEAMRAGTP